MWTTSLYLEYLVVGERPVVWLGLGLIMLLLLGFLYHHQRTKQVITSTKSKKKDRRMTVCPFSAESNFIVETAEHLPPSPLDLYESWLSADTNNNNKPLAARWLAAGLSGQDSPGMLRAGLKRLRNSKHFLVQEEQRLPVELALKNQALDNPERFPKLFVMEEDSLAAQTECLQLFCSYLPKRYPEWYHYNASQGTIRVLDTTYRLQDFQKRPLELCERLVQEDLVLMRPPRSNQETSYCMTAAAVVFSFDGLIEKLGQPVEFIHAPVPGYERHLRKTLNLTFDKLLKVEQPMWRNNWVSYY